MTALQIENIGNTAVKQLRINKLKSGFPFMINSNELPTNTCYLEYPDGVIKLVTIKKDARDFTWIRDLSDIETKLIREKYNLAAI